MNASIRTLTLAVLGLLAPGTWAGEAIKESREVDADGVISIELVNGVIAISGHDDSVFSIEGELSDAAEGFTLDASNGNIRFEEHIERNRWFWGDGRRQAGKGAQLDIRVPRHSVLRFEGTNTDLDISGLAGNSDVEVINGAIVASALEGVVRLETVNGSIDSEGLAGRVSLETVNGSITDRASRATRARFEAVNGSIRSDTLSPHVTASNVNGSIELDLQYVDELEVSTVSGSIDVFGFLNELAHVDIASVGGNVDLSLPATTSASFHVSTAVGGRIRNELSADEPAQRNHYVNSRELDFVINGGNGDVNISTVSGNVTLNACGPDDC